MNATRLWTLGSIVVIIALLAGTWLIGVSPRLTEAAQANDETANVEAQNLVQEATLAALQRQFDDKDSLLDELAEIQEAMPDALELPDLINEIHGLSGRSGVVVQSLTLGAPAAYVQSVDAPPADPQFTAALAGITPENLLVVPIDVTVTGTYGSVMAFVSSLQTGKRLLLVHDVALLSGAMSSDAVVEYSLAGQLFVLMDAATAVPASTETADGSEAATTE